MDTYFIRHAWHLGVVDDAIKYLWENDLIAIHFPDVFDSATQDDEDKTSLEPNDYSDQGAKNAVSRFKELNENGGYIWAEYRDIDVIKVGKIKPGSFRIHETFWRPGQFNYNRVAKLKTLQFEKDSIKLIEPSKEIALKAARPPFATITHWPSVGEAVISLADDIKTDFKWGRLSTAEQETVCSEYLRNPDFSHCPSLDKLLLPIGRTMKDIDIFGICKDDSYLYCQVTYSHIDKIDNKIEALKKYHKDNSQLIMFCSCEDITYKDSILFIPIMRVENWLKKEVRYYNKIVQNKN